MDTKDKHNKKEKIIENKNDNKEGSTNPDTQQGPQLTLDVLVGVRQLFGVAINRKAFNEEEMKTVAGLFNHFAMCVERMVIEFQESNPELVEKLMKSAEEHKKKYMEQQKKGQLDSIPEEQPMPENIKNGCDAGDGDIQG